MFCGCSVHAGSCGFSILRRKNVMGFKSDIEIAQEAVPQDIREISKKIGLTEDDLELYGKYKAKIDYNLMKTKPGSDKKAKLILTTAVPWTGIRC